jgi:hypothetical protein
MFCSIMRVLHDNLPCTKNYFIQKRRYRNLMNSVNPTRRRSSSPSVKEIASPKFVKGLQFNRRDSVNSKDFEHSNKDVSPHSRHAEDFRVKTNVNPAHIRNSSMQNSQAMSAIKNEESKEVSLPAPSKGRMKVGVSDKNRDFSPLTRSMGYGVRIASNMTESEGNKLGLTSPKGGMLPAL